MKKIKENQRESGVVRITLGKVDREGLSTKVTFELKPEG
jgi:hypothetical protein